MTSNACAQPVSKAQVDGTSLVDSMGGSNREQIFPRMGNETGMPSSRLACSVKGASNNQACTNGTQGWVLLQNAYSERQNTKCAIKNKDKK